MQRRGSSGTPAQRSTSAIGSRGQVGWRRGGGRILLRRNSSRGLVGGWWRLTQHHREHENYTELAFEMTAAGTYSSAR